MTDDRTGKIGSLIVSGVSSRSTPCRCNVCIVQCLAKKYCRSLNAAPFEQTTKSVAISKLSRWGKDMKRRRADQVSVGMCVHLIDKFVILQDALDSVDSVQGKNVG